MFPRGIIYESKKDSLHGYLILQATRKQRFVYGFIRGIGAGLTGFAVIAVLFMYWPIAREEVIYTTSQAVETPLFKQEAQELGLNSAFSIYIPKINAKANIIANVDAGNEKSYKEALSHGVAHAAGTYFPGQGETIYLFAHSTDTPWNIERYNAVFYLLKELTLGDKITVFFADKKYEYQVTDKQITAPKDTSWFNQIHKERLILQTCYPPGTTQKRLLIIAEPVK